MILVQAQLGLLSDREERQGANLSWPESHGTRQEGRRSKVSTDAENNKGGCGSKSVYNKGTQPPRNGNERCGHRTERRRKKIVDSRAPLRSEARANPAVRDAGVGASRHSDGSLTLTMRLWCRGVGGRGWGAPPAGSAETRRRAAFLKRARQSLTAPRAGTACSRTPAPRAQARRQARRCPGRSRP